MTAMDTPLIPVKFFARNPRRELRWDLDRVADAARLWYYVPRVGEAVYLLDEKEVTEKDGGDHPPHSEMTVPRVISGKVSDVIWSDDGVTILLLMN